MISVAPALTDSGKSLLIRAIGGETITFTRFKLGNGELSSGTSPATLTDLINPLVTFSIKSIDDTTTGYVKLTGSFDSTDITNDFRWREFGLFCEGETSASFNGNGSTNSFTIADKPTVINGVKVAGTSVTVSAYNASTGVVTLAAAPASGTNNVVAFYPSGDEKLYAYSNDGNNAGILKANATDVVAEQTVALIVEIGEAENVTAIISESVLYARKTDFDNHVNGTNPHNVTKTQIGLGNVPNVSTNNQTPTYTLYETATELTSGEILSTAFGKIAKAVKDFISHIGNSDNPHHITASAIQAAAQEHNHSAADINAGTLSVARGGSGKTQWVKNGIVYANGTNELSQVSIPTVSSYLVQNNGAFSWVPASKVGRKITKFVVGTSTNGWSAENCDYLCDGVDDQVEINRALAALPSTGGTVVLLDGNYSIDGNITMSKEFSILQGTGASIVTFSGAFVISIGADNCTVQDLVIQSSSTSSNSSGISAVGRKRTLLRGLRTKIVRIYLNECTNSIIAGNFIGEANGYNYGICLEGGKGNLVSNNNTSEAYYGICATNESNLVIIGNTTVVTNEYGMFCTGCNDVTITGNVVYSSVGGFTTGYRIYSCNRVSFCNNSGFLESGASGKIAEFTSCSKITVMGNILKNLVNNYALYFSSCNNCTSIGNMLSSLNSNYAYYATSCSSMTSVYNQSFTETA